MPLLEVTDVLDDVDFFDVYTINRSTVIVGSGGVPVKTTEKIAGAGVVTPATWGNLQNLPEGTLQSGAIQIITRDRLRTGGSTEMLPDIVTWNKQNYTVIAIQDYSRFGAGFVQATASMRDTSPPEVLP